tara:strand:- start:450 stop:740 length:291 start_codon:yes stop_codon:yes gene_type:complete
MAKKILINKGCGFQTIDCNEENLIDIAIDATGGDGFTDQSELKNIIEFAPFNEDEGTFVGKHKIIDEEAVIEFIEENSRFYVQNYLNKLETVQPFN